MIQLPSVTSKILSFDVMHITYRAICTSGAGVVQAACQHHHHLLEGVEPVIVVARRGDLGVELWACVEVVVVAAESCNLELLSLLCVEHA